LGLIALSGCRLFATYEFVDTATGAKNIEVSGEIVDFLTRVPISGVEVCALERPDIACVVANADGLYTLTGIPANEAGILEYTRSGYKSGLHFVVSGAENVTTDYEMIDEIQLALLSAVLDPPVDPDSALVLSHAESNGEGTPGTVASLDPASGNGPVYASEEGIIDLDATAVIDRIGIWYGLPDGDYTVTMVHPTLDCQPTGGWPADGLSSHGTRAYQGYLSTAAPFECQ